MRQFSHYHGDYISIHAPTRGATKGGVSMSLHQYISIHAPTRGATIVFYIYEGNDKFQSTLPREERPRTAKKRAESLKNFNPRSHERSDPRGNTNWDRSYISIHAPTRGATQIVCVVFVFISISIHAPTRGATAILHKKFVYFYTIPTINI